MLVQGSVSDLIMDRVSREKGYVVITMRRYPRFIRRELRDEYLTSMSPDSDLHAAWLKAKRKNGHHNAAFARVDYENRFTVSEAGWADLERLCRLAKRKTVYLVCQCRVGDRCHREMLLILADQLFHAPVEKPKNDYPEFRKRIPGFRRSLTMSKTKKTKRVLKTGKAKLLKDDLEVAKRGVPTQGRALREIDEDIVRFSQSTPVRKLKKLKSRTPSKSGLN